MELCIKTILYLLFTIPSMGSILKGVQERCLDNFRPQPRVPDNKEAKEELDYDPDSLLSFSELVDKYGYNTKEHNVVTKDGYILKLFQIPGGKNCNGPLHKTPLIMMHGLADSSDTFIVSGPDKGLGYIMPDQCYNTFFANSRGNKHSRKHVCLDPDKNGTFWDYTYDEMGLYDLPAIIDYVLDNTGAEQVFYIGHSQGGGQLFTLTSTIPEYNKKIKLGITMAPAAWLYNLFSPILRVIAAASCELKLAVKTLGTRELLADRTAEQEFMQLACQFAPSQSCGSRFYAITGLNPEKTCAKTFRVLSGHFPSGTSLDNLNHLGQAIKVNKFQRYDWGDKVNFKKYGCKHPPQYDMSKVSAPVVILGGKHDWLVTRKDLNTLYRNLPNVVEYRFMDDDDWSHLDFVWGDRIPDQLAPLIIDHLSTCADN